MRRRLILDHQGFAVGAVTVVTGQPESEIAERVRAHSYGGAERNVVQIGGVQMVRIDAEPHAVLARPGPTFVVVFERGQETSEEGREDLARATVAGIAAGADGT